MDVEPHHTPAGEDGFTIIEVMVASLVLLVGLLGIIRMLDASLSATAATNERVGATNIAREIVETSRGLDYDELAPAALVPALEAHGLGTGTPLVITRRGVTYTASATVCTFDSPADGIATALPDNVCTPQAAGVAGAPADQNGDDFRRLTFEVAWTNHGTPRSVTQSELIVNPSGGLGPRITAINPLTQTITTNPVNVDVLFTTAPAASVHWHVDDGSSEGDAAGPTGTPQVWRVRWPIGFSGSSSEVLDGAYQLIAQAFDDRSTAGDAKLATIVLNRRQPYAPPALVGGHDTRVSDWVDLSWRLNSERDILGYRVYWAGSDGVAGNGNDELVTCYGTSASAAMLEATVSSCTDASQHSTGAQTYYVVALDRNTSGDPREGERRPATIAAAGSQPAKPGVPLGASTVANLPRLTWNAPASGSPLFYRIYRDGTALSNRQGRTSGATTSWSDDDAGAGAHQYWVTTVNSAYNESDPTGPVSWTP